MYDVDVSCTNSDLLDSHVEVFLCEKKQIKTYVTTSNIPVLW